MGLFSDISQAFSWLKKVFTSHSASADSVAITITEAIKSILANPVANFLEQVGDAVTHTNLPTDIANCLSNTIIPKVLAAELALQGLPPNPSVQQIQAFGQAVLTAFNVTSDNSKLYTVLTAQIYGEIQTTLNTTPGKFADWVIAIEASYADYQKDLAGNAVPSVVG